MSTIVTDNKHYSDIANAIRAKNGESTQYKPSEMALAISNIKSGENIISILPEGYTQLEYIQGTGTQYIDTGYIPNQNTRIVLDAYIVPTETTEPVFGARTALAENAFALWVYGNTVNPQYGNVSYNTQSISMDYDRRLVYELNKNVFTVDGTTKTFAETTFNSTYPMYIFQINNFGSAFSRGSKGKLYSCQIYDNDILIRDFVPCINPSAEVGLYEMVNGVFYGNAGSGSFAGGQRYNTNIVCLLTVETEAGATVTATLDEIVVSATANENGLSTLILEKAGVWTVTATLDGKTATTEVDINLSVTANLAFVDPILANNSWETISKIAREGKASEYWKVGDTKPITVAGGTYNAQIMDFDMYDVADPESYGRTKAGIVFQYKEAVEANYSWDNAQANVNDWITNYCECQDLIPVIKYPKLAAYNATTPTIYEAKGINPSEQEVFGTTTKEKVAVGTQYAFYAAGNDKKKYTPSSSLVFWWTRSKDKQYSTRYVYISTTGAVSSGTSSCSCAPVFCL